MLMENERSRRTTTLEQVNSKQAEFLKTVETLIKLMEETPHLLMCGKVSGLVFAHPHHHHHPIPLPTPLCLQILLQEHMHMHVPIPIY